MKIMNKYKEHAIKAAFELLKAGKDLLQINGICLLDYEAEWGRAHLSNGIEMVSNAFKRPIKIETSIYLPEMYRRAVNIGDFKIFTVGETVKPAEEEIG